jgi:glycosyltransferase involved in cell wall biosynthesis
VFFLVGATVDLTRRSGVHRVVLETARALSPLTELCPVRYDPLEGGLRRLDGDELDRLFGPGDWPAGLKLDPSARRVGAPFRAWNGPAGGAWLLVPEVVWHEVHGTEHLARAISQCRAWGVPTATIFYDLIPIQNQVYSGGAIPHAAYVAALVRSDLIVPISRDSGERLAAYWTAQGVSPQPPIRPLLLPDGGFGRQGSRAPTARGAGPVALVGTVEPRKRQLEFLEAYAAARARGGAAAGRDVLVIGSLHPYVADRFNAFIARHRWVKYLDYASDARVLQAYEEAPFSAFVSDDEGYGLPISESLATGTPCLCANFGAMAEIAQNGGCLTVDVRNPVALEGAIATLLDQPAVLERLRREIAERAFETWTDYARGLLERMAEAAPPSEVAVARIARVADAPPPADVLADAEVLCFGAEAAREAAIKGLAPEDGNALAPTRWTVGEAAARAAAKALADAQSRRRRVAELERAYRLARSAVVGDEGGGKVFLRIVISTFNRRDFVRANVTWLLKDIIRPETGVDLVVVDGGSTDGTVAVLKAIADPRLMVMESPVNVGMLAGLREASRVRGAEYIWIVGDDDFIQPGALQAVLAGLRANAGVPFGFVNFSVYHRAAWSAFDRPKDLIAEAVPMAKAPAPTGLTRVARAAEQHDNLFTAIYAIIWRADVLSAAYDHTFDGSPFSNMTEAVPCTEAILDQFGACEAWWLADLAVAGNAHNGWSRHRPRWHGLVMPQVFALAREVGVDRKLLQAWGGAHFDLFREALAIAGEKGFEHGLEPKDLELARIVFRRNAAAELPQ